MPIDNFKDVERARYSLFAEWKGEIAPKLSTELGIRYTYTYANSGDVMTTMMNPRKTSIWLNRPIAPAWGGELCVLDSVSATLVTHTPG